MAPSPLLSHRCGWATPCPRYLLPQAKGELVGGLRASGWWRSEAVALRELARRAVSDSDGGDGDGGGGAGGGGGCALEVGKVFAALERQLQQSQGGAWDLKMRDEASTLLNLKELFQELARLRGEELSQS